MKGGILPPELRASSWCELTVRDGKGGKDRRTMLPREEESGCESSCRRCDASMKKNWQSLVQKAIRRAMRAAEINKAATSHCFRHS